MKRAFIILAIWCCLVSHCGAKAKARRWLPKDARTKVIARIDFECANQIAFGKAKLNRKVARIFQHSERWGIKWGNIAFAYDLNKDSIPEYFVPLQCSATGNCDWGVFAGRPVRLLGIINGEWIFPRQLSIGRWPAISTCSHQNASDCMLVTFCFRRGKYQPCTRGYVISAYQHNEPKWFGTIHPLCDLNQ